MSSTSTQTPLCTPSGHGTRLLLFSLFVFMFTGSFIYALFSFAYVLSKPSQIRPSHSARLGGHFHFLLLPLSGKAIIASSSISVILVPRATATLLSLVRCSFANLKEQRCLLIFSMSCPWRCPDGPTDGDCIREVCTESTPFFKKV